MKREVNVRYKPHYSNEIIIQREYHPVWFIPIFWWVWKWKDWKLLDEKKYKIEAKLNKHASEMKKLLIDLQAAEEELAKDKKQLKKDMEATRGEPRPFTIQDALFFKAGKFLDPPSGEWRAVLNPKLLNNKKDHIRERARERSGASDLSTSKNNQTTTTLKEFSKHKSSLEEIAGMDGMNFFEDPSDKKNKSWKNRKKGESDWEYKERMKQGPNS